MMTVSIDTDRTNDPLECARMPHEPFAIERRTGRRVGQLVLQVFGPLDYSTVDMFLEETRIETAPVVILDLAGVESADSRGIGALAQLHVSFRRENRRFAVAGLTTKVRYVLGITRLVEVLTIFPNVADAEAALLTDAGITGG